MTIMIFVTFISIYFVIICDVLLWRTYETQTALSFKSGCDTWDPLEWFPFGTESRLEGVNRQNLKIINFEHSLCPGLVLEIIRSVKYSSPCYELLNQCG
jgi:hypothetical protein